LGKVADEEDREERRNQMRKEGEAGSVLTQNPKMRQLES
jgi:hypothetical protein